MLKNPYFQLMRFDKPIGIFLLLWPTYWALWLAANGIPSLKNLFIFTCGVVVMRTAGCVINDIADRDFDKHVSRTRLRPITSGQIATKKAVFLFLTLCIIAFFLVLFTNKHTVTLAFFALFFAIIYPFMKRHTHWPQLVLGIAFSFSIPMAFAAEINTVPLNAWLLMLTNILWTIAYDTEYALADRQDDLKIGIKSTAILFAEHNPLIIGILQCLVMLLLITIGFYERLAWPYYVGICFASILFLYQQHLIRPDKKVQFLKAFLNNHWVGFFIFLGIFFNFFTG